MQTIIVFLLILIVLLLGELVVLNLKAERRREPLSIPERIEERRIQKERRAAEREQSEEATRRMKLMKEVEDYNGDIR